MWGGPEVDRVRKFVFTNNLWFIFKILVVWKEYNLSKKDSWKFKIREDLEFVKPSVTKSLTLHTVAIR